MGLNDSRFPHTTSCCIMRFISAICSFIYMNSTTLTSKAKRSLVDITLARDLVIMGSQRNGNLDCFLSNLFSLGS